MADAPAMVQAKSPAQRRFDDALEIVSMRRRDDGPMKEHMAQLAARVNGDFVIPLPDVKGEPQFPQIAASIIASSIESNAQRANDMEPVLHVAAKSDSDLQHRKAREREKAWASMYRETAMNLRRGRAFRHLNGYATFTFAASPMFTDRNDLTRGRATITTRNPLTSYPEPMDTDEIRRPRNVAFVYGRTMNWLRWAYPDTRSFLEERSTDAEELWDVLEWHDDEYVIVGILGKRADSGATSSGATSPDGWARHTDRPSDNAMFLHAREQRVGHVPVFVARSVTFDKLISRAMRAIPVTDLQNKVAMLNYLAAERAVFPDRYVIGRDGYQPKIVGGHWKKGASGDVNLLQDVASIGDLQTAPGPLTPQLMADLERAGREIAGHPGLFSGELTGSLRSGQTVSQLGAYAIDPDIKEQQQIMAHALRLINESAAETEKAYFPKTKIFGFTGWPGDDATVEYEPADLWDDTRHDVDYPMPGMTAADAITAVLNMVQTGMMSEETGRTILPWIRDTHGEGLNIVAANLRQAAIAAFVQGAATGATAITDVVRALELIEGGMEPAKAIQQVQTEAQERQTTPAPEPGAPETAPGINAPGAGGEQPAPDAGGAPQMGLEEALAAFRAAPPGGGGGMGGGMAAGVA